MHIFLFFISAALAVGILNVYAHAVANALLNLLDLSCGFTAQFLVYWGAKVSGNVVQP